MEILKDFGIEPILLGAQVVNFLIILYVLKRFLYKPVMDMIKKREDTIKEGLQQAEKAKITLEKSLEEESKILKKAQDQAKKIIEEAKAQSSIMKQELEETAKQRADKILSDAQIQISQDTKDAEKRLVERINDLAINMLAKSAKELFDEKEEKAIISKALKKIKKTN
ncbi:F0F1 ATP synthase subunit B [Patescibacteria group bacterium]|nr:F0F1 ATP synthase subunit B [Patescibacteria group bacterium]